MDALDLTQTLLSTQTPLLPQAGLMHVYRVLGWGLVLASIALWWLQCSTERSIWRRGLPWLLLLWCFLPGPLSPAYWLGLAFRAPSLLAVLLCAWALLSHYRPQWLAPWPREELRRWALAPVLLGWVLLLDAFALWPLSVYSLGFAPLTLGVLVLLGLLPWLLRGVACLSVLLVATLAMFVLLRLPNGNVWDAMLDPWLWVLLQADWLRRSLSARRAQG